MRFSQLLRNGAIAGAAAGVAAAVVMLVLTEPVIRRALVVEDARPDGAHHGDAVVSRTSQEVFGPIVVIIAGVLFGLVFAVVFAKSRHRLPGATDHSRALWLAVLGFAAFTLMPAVAIPSNPPAAGDPDTVNQRTLVYVLAVLVALLVIGAVFGLDRLLRHREVDASLRLSADIAASALLVAVALWALPAVPAAIPADMPADVVWDFRVASLAQLGTMWLALGTVFGLMATRSRSARPAEPALHSRG